MAAMLDGVSPGKPDRIFKMVYKVGQGQNGAVYKAIDTRDGSMVAIKIIQISPGADYSALKQEVNVLRQCQAEGIVGFKGVFADDGNFWIVMEFCSAGSVQDLLTTSKRGLSEDLIGALLKMILPALLFLHQHKRMHRDLKCGNLLLTHSGECKLADFGIAANFDVESKRSTVIGTPYWIAPEMIKFESYDEKADIWSLGITVLEMVSQVPPYFELAPMRALYKIAERPAPSLPEGAWSDEFKSFVGMCLVKDPLARASCEQLLASPFLTSAKAKSFVAEHLTNAIENLPAPTDDFDRGSNVDSMMGSFAADVYDADDSASFTEIKQESKVGNTKGAALVHIGVARMKHATSITKFADDLKEFEDKFRACAVVQDRTYHLKKYEDCFVANETIDKLVASKTVSNRQEAVAKGELLRTIGMFEHVMKAHRFKDEYLFYRFAAPVLDPSFVDVYVMLKNLPQEQRLALMGRGFGTTRELPTADAHSTSAPLVFIHGIYGSHLHSFRARGHEDESKGLVLSSLAAEECYWINVFQGLGGKSDIRLPMAWRNGRQAYGPKPLIAANCIHTVAKLVKTYGPFLDWAEHAFPSGFFHPFAYDWRRDNNESVDLFILHLEAVVARHKCRPVVVAHSNGGLIALAAVNERPDLFRGLVFCGAALGPGVAFMLDFQYGSGAKDKKGKFFPGILNSSALCTHPSYYSFLLQGQAAAPWASHPDFWNPKCTLADGTDVDLGDVQTWITHRLGVFRTKGDEEAKKIHMINVLACAKRMRERAAPKPRQHYPPLRAVVARHKSVVRQVEVEGEGELREVATTPGDGRVPWYAARPGGDVECPVIETTFDHSAIPNDIVHVQQAIMEVLGEGKGPETCPF